MLGGRFWVERRPGRGLINRHLFTFSPCMTTFKAFVGDGYCLIFNSL
jgi:hypothetical protein